MIVPGPHCRVWIAAGVTDMRRGMAGLSAMVQTQLGEQPFSGDVFAFRGRRGDLVKLLWWSGDGMNLYVKRLERGRFVWPQAASGVVLTLPRFRVHQPMQISERTRPQRGTDIPSPNAVSARCRNPRSS